MTLADVLDPPGDFAIQAGGRGELLVARIRLWIVLLLSPIPIVDAVEYPHWENWIGAGIIVVALTGSVLLYRAASHDPTRGWLGIASTASDVTLISLSLGAFMFFGEPITATNSFVVFGAYYLAIMATALRHDPRLSLLAGLLAVGQYALIVIVAVTQFDLMSADAVSERYGSFSWGTQVSRMILLTAASALATIIVLRQGELLHRSSIDSLTGLYNRSAFDERLASEIIRSRRHRHPLSVAMIDIDLFKRINDEHGHTAGDEALAGFAEALRAEFRQTDLVARYGGEEFLVMLPETPPDGATTKLERVVRTIAERDFTITKNRTALRLTVSVGVAGAPGDVDDMGRLLQVADARLFEAKRAGRDRVVGVDAPVGDAA